MADIKRLTRRTFVRSVGFSTGAVAVSALLAACGSAAAPTQAPAPPAKPTEPSATAPKPTEAVKGASAPVVPPASKEMQAIGYGSGNVSITMWAQNFGAIIDAFKAGAKAYSEKQNNVKVSIVPIAGADLQAKILPAVAAGDEAELMFGYTQWYVATDLSKLFLPLDDYVGNRASLSKIIYPNVLNMLSSPNGKLYYMPYMSGQDGTAVAVNVKHYQDKGIDYTKFGTIDDVIEAGKMLVVKEGDRITRAGLTFTSVAFHLVKTWIVQQGGDFYNAETGKWNVATPEGENALQLIYDVIWKHQTTSFDLFANDNEGWLRGQTSTQAVGSWTVQAAEVSQQSYKADAVPLPKLKGATSDTVTSRALAVISLSRRLPNDDAKLKQAVGLMQEMFTPDSLVGVTDVYSGTLCSQQVYDDPRTQKTKYGPVSKRIAESVWPRARYVIGHVANVQPADAELDRALRKQISIKEALQNVDTYMNQQEATARQRIQ